MKKLLLMTLVLLCLGGASVAQQKRTTKVLPKKSAAQKAHNDRIIALKKARQTATPATGEVTKPATAARKD
jgi:Tfp pilus assembly protein PilN